MAVNKVEYAGNILIDLTNDTVTPETLADGVTAHDKSGNLITGTMQNGGEENQIDKMLNGSIATINSNVNKIIGYGCYGIRTLVSVNLPEATSIGTYAFRNCDNLASINAPKVTSLGTYAFYGTKITEAIFPFSATVPSNCFYTCSALTKADFGAAKSIGGYSFYACAKLQKLILRYTEAVVTVQSTSLTSSGIARGTGYVYVPSALIESYKTATNWSAYAEQFRAIEDYPDITGG